MSMAVGASAVGTGLSILSSLLGGFAGRDAADDRADMIRREQAYNRFATGIQISLLNTRRDMEKAQQGKAEIFQRRAIRKAAIQTAGSQRARFAKAGVDVSAGGSPMDILAETAAEADYDTRIASYNRTVSGLLTDYEADVNAAMIRINANQTQAKLAAGLDAARNEALASITAGWISAASSLVGGLSNYLDLKTGLSPGAKTDSFLQNPTNTGLGTGHSQPYGN